MLQSVLYSLVILGYSSSRHYLIQTAEEEFSGIETVNDSLNETLVNRYKY